MKTKTITIILIIYFIGAFLTNSYVRQYRYDDWKEQSSAPNKDGGADLTVVVTTIIWPVYILSRLSDEIINLRICDGPQS